MEAMNENSKWVSRSGRVLSGVNRFSEGSGKRKASKMKMTDELLHSAATNGCGFSSEQLFLLTGTPKPSKGWLINLIGTELPDELWQRVIALKGSKSKETRLQKYIERENGDSALAEMKRIVLASCMLNLRMKRIVAMPMTPEARLLLKIAIKVQEAGGASGLGIEADEKAILRGDS